MELAELDRLLGDSSTAIRPGLTQFINETTRSEARREPCQLCAAYVAANPDCAQLFALWDDQRLNKNNAESHVVQEALACVLRYTGQTPAAKDTGTVVIRKILSHYMKAIYQGLSSTKIALNKASLRLLTAIVRHNTASARDLLQHLDLSIKSFSTLARRRGKEEKWDIRSLLFSFAMSLLNTQDGDVVRQTAQAKPFLSHLMRDLSRDKPHTVELVIRTLTRSVATDVIPRQTRLSIFTPHLLSELAAICEYDADQLQYARSKQEAESLSKQDHVDETKPGQKRKAGHLEEDGDSKDKTIEDDVTDGGGADNSTSKGSAPPVFISERAQKLLMLLVTSSPGGLALPLKTLSSTQCVWKEPWRRSRSGNDSLLKLLLSLSNVSMNPFKRALVTKCLAACPDITPSFFEGATISCEPRPSLRWLANMTLCKAIASIAPPSLRTAGPVSTLEHRVESIAPTCLGRVNLSKGLQAASSPLLRWTCLQVLLPVLQRLDTTVKEAATLCQSPDAETRAAWKGFPGELCSQVQKRLPDAQVLQQLTHQLLEEAALRSATEATASSELQGPDLVLVVALRCLRYYAVHFAATSSNDLAKTLIAPEALLRMQPLVQRAILDLQAQVPKASASAVVPDTNTSRLHCLATIVASATASAVQQAARQALLSALNATSVLQERHIFMGEGQIWVTLIRYGMKQPADILADSIEALLKDPFQAAETTMKAHREAGCRDLEISPLLASFLAAALDRDAISDWTALYLCRVALEMEAAMQNVAPLQRLLSGDVIDILAGRASAEGAAVLHGLRRRLALHASKDGLVHVKDKTKPVSSKAGRAGASPIDGGSHELRVMLGATSSSIHDALQQLSETSAPLMGHQRLHRLFDCVTAVALASEQPSAMLQDVLHYKSAAQLMSLPVTLSMLHQETLSKPSVQSRLMDMSQLGTSMSHQAARALAAIVSKTRTLLLESAPGSVVGSLHARCGFLADLFDSFSLKMIHDHPRHVLACCSLLTADDVLELVCGDDKVAKCASSLVHNAARVAAAAQARLGDGMTWTVALLQKLSHKVTSAIFTTRCTLSEPEAALDLVVSVYEEMHLSPGLQKDVSVVLRPLVEALVLARSDDDISMTMQDGKATLGDRRRATRLSHQTWSFVRLLQAQGYLLVSQLPPSQAFGLLKLMASSPAAELVPIVFSILGIRGAVFESKAAQGIFALEGDEAPVSSVQSASYVAQFSSAAVEPHYDGMLPAAAEMLCTISSTEFDTLLDTLVQQSLESNGDDGRGHACLCAYTACAIATSSNRAADLLVGHLERSLFGISGVTEDSPSTLIFVHWVLFALSRSRSRAATARLATLAESVLSKLLPTIASNAGALTQLESAIAQLGLKHPAIVDAERLQLSWAIVEALSSSSLPCETLSAGHAGFLSTALTTIAESVAGEGRDEGVGETRDPLVLFVRLATTLCQHAALVAPQRRWQDVKMKQAQTAEAVIPSRTAADQASLALALTCQVGLEPASVKEAASSATNKSDDVSVITHAMLERMLRQLATNADAGVVAFSTDRVTSAMVEPLIRATNQLLNTLSLDCPEDLSASQLLGLRASLSFAYALQPMTMDVLLKPPADIAVTLLGCVPFRNVMRMQHIDAVSAGERRRATVTGRNERARIAAVLCVGQLLLQKVELVEERVGDILVESYDASACPSDRLILKILRACEQNPTLKVTGATLRDRVMLFGPDAGETIGRIRSQRDPLGVDSVAVEALERLSTERMHDSLGKLAPLDQARIDEITISTALDDAADVDITTLDCSFVLPLIYSLIRSEGINLYQFVEKDCLSFALLAMASDYEETRRLAGAILAQTLSTVEADEALKGRAQLGACLESLRNSITALGMQIPTLAAWFMVRATRLALHPEQAPMYPLLNKFMLQRPVLDLLDVPMLYNLLNSGSRTFKVERSWILRLLIKGLRTKQDLEVFKRRHIFQLLMALHDSEIGDSSTRHYVREVLLQACQLPFAALELCTRHGFCAWLSSSLSASHVSTWHGSDSFRVRYDSVSGAVQLMEALATTAVRSDWPAAVQRSVAEELACVLSDTVDILTELAQSQDVDVSSAVEHLVPASAGVYELVRSSHATLPSLRPTLALLQLAQRILPETSIMNQQLLPRTVILGFHLASSQRLDKATSCTEAQQSLTWALKSLSSRQDQSNWEYFALALIAVRLSLAESRSWLRLLLNRDESSMSVATRHVNDNHSVLRPFVTVAFQELVASNVASLKGDSHRQHDTSMRVAAMECLTSMLAFSAAAASLAGSEHPDGLLSSRSSLFEGNPKSLVRMLQLHFGRTSEL